jgi:hypothetical protein
MATGCDVILATTVWAFKASECDRRAVDPTKKPPWWRLSA